MPSKKFKIYIDAACNIPYSSYYIKGFYEKFGKNNVSFSANHFKNLDRFSEEYSYDAYMAVILSENGKEKKIIIDFGDDYPVRKNAYNWCDIYAKININKNKSDLDTHSKLHSITPGFGIRIWNPFEVFSYSIFNFIKCKFRINTSFKNHFRSYASQLKAFKIEDFTYENFKETKNYVFFVSTLWPHINCITGTNLYRKQFVEKCIKSGVEFEGGFFTNQVNHPQLSIFKDLMMQKRFPLKEYIQKTKKSALVFNTPAVHNCHGWKLGQYLAMGKAIISTPLINILPQRLENGKNILFFDNDQELETGIDRVLNDDNLRKNMELEAKKYYDEYAAPLAVIAGIVNKLEEQ